MEIQQQKLSTLSASNVSPILSSQNKRKIPTSKLSTNINQSSYNQQLVWNRFSLHTAGRYVSGASMYKLSILVFIIIFSTNSHASWVEACEFHGTVITIPDELKLNDNKATVIITKSSKSTEFRGSGYTDCSNYLNKEFTIKYDAKIGIIGTGDYLVFGWFHTNHKTGTTNEYVIRSNSKPTDLE
jgi:hypothetical protein